jgi:hypothetical protein
VYLQLYIWHLNIHLLILAYLNLLKLFSYYDLTFICWIFNYFTNQISSWQWLFGWKDCCCVYVFVPSCECYPFRHTVMSDKTYCVRVTSVEDLTQGFFPPSVRVLSYVPPEITGTTQVLLIRSKAL